MNEIITILIWLSGIELIGLLALPIAAYLCRLIPDRGYSITKPLGVLILTYFTWLPVSLHLVSFGPMSIAISFVILFLFSVLVVLKKKLAGFSDQRAYVIKSEFIFLAAFSIMAFILSYKPDIIANGSEDFMDYAFLQSVMRSTYFPPVNPWLSGEVLSYYYFGHLAVAILTIFSQIPSNITYNLAVSTLFGLTVSAAYGIGYNLTRRSIYGMVAAIFVSVSGILSGFLQLLVYLVPSTKEFILYAPLSSHGLLQWLYDFDFWTPITTMIPETFIYYPYHTFVHGYLHGQMTSLTFQIMFLTLCLAILKDRGIRISSPLFLITVLSLGFFTGLNIWEYPTYLAVLCLILFTKAYEKYADINNSWRYMIQNGGTAALISIILYLPYYVTRESGGFHGVLPVVQRTKLLGFLEAFGLFIFIIISFFFIYYAAYRERIPIRYYKAGAFILIPAIIIAAVWDFQLLPLLAAIVILAAYGAVKQRGQDEECFSFLLIAAGGLVALFAEILYIADAMPWPRFNTVMKLYLQIWILWGVASAYSIYYIHQHMKNKGSEVILAYKRIFPRAAYMIWAAILIFLIFASLIHPIASTVSWTVGSGASIFGNTQNGTLDGTRYLQKIHRDDYMAIQWIEKNIQGNPTMLEAPGVAYQYTSQIATMTGIPTVLGWKTHEMMWNNNWSKIDEREIEIDRIYSTNDINYSLQLLKKYDIKYVYIGENERTKYKTGLEKFEDERYFERIYREYVEIYRVKYP